MVTLMLHTNSVRINKFLTLPIGSRLTTGEPRIYTD
jgi:hypothetical protein